MPHRRAMTHADCFPIKKARGEAQAFPRQRAKSATMMITVTGPAYFPATHANSLTASSFENFLTPAPSNSKAASTPMACKAHLPTRSKSSCLSCAGYAHWGKGAHRP